VDIEELRRLAANVAEHMSDDRADMIDLAADEIARLREERRSISTLHQKVEGLEADNKRLRDERRWVSVGERLPEEDLQVLVWGKGWSSPAIGWREHRPWYIVPETIWTLGDEIDLGYPPQDITHWQPLPPGPGGDA
jgi:hypothetical protein